MKYIFKLECPHCHNRADQIVGKYEEAPRLHCGDCLWNRIDVVEFKIVSVEYRTMTNDELRQIATWFRNECRRRVKPSMYLAEITVYAKSIGIDMHHQDCINLYHYINDGELPC